MDTRTLPAYVPLEKLTLPRPVDRIPYLAEAARGRKVLDLGAMDETAFKSKRGNGTWLHEELARTARQVLGVDASIEVPESGLETGPNSRIVLGNILDLSEVLRLEQFAPDVVIAGELIEHLENPLAFLRSLKAEPALSGKVLYLSTPNATALHNGLVGLLGRESTHQDHLCILSFKTLCTLCSRAGFSSWEIQPYKSDFVEMKSRTSGPARWLVSAGEACVNGGEWMFPLLSFGYIVRAEI